jgi:hypothetical protein
MWLLTRPCKPCSISPAYNTHRKQLYFNSESWVRNSLSVSIWSDALAVISINPIRHRRQALS